MLRPLAGRTYISPILQRLTSQEDDNRPVPLGATHCLRPGRPPDSFWDGSACPMRVGAGGPDRQLSKITNTVWMLDSARGKGPRNMA